MITLFSAVPAFDNKNKTFYRARFTALELQVHGFPKTLDSTHEWVRHLTINLIQLDYQFRVKKLAWSKIVENDLNRIFSKAGLEAFRFEFIAEETVHGSRLVNIKFEHTSHATLSP